MVTGDYLFDPKKGKTYTKNDDHLASISELIGECRDKKFLDSCESAGEFYGKNGKLKRIKKLKEWKLYDILAEKYRVKDTEALFLARFLEKCLKWNPLDRPTAQQLLDDPWLKMQPRYDARMDQRHYNEFMTAVYPDYEPSQKTSSEEEEKALMENAGLAAEGDPDDEENWESGSSEEGGQTPAGKHDAAAAAESSDSDN